MQPVVVKTDQGSMGRRRRRGAARGEGPEGNRVNVMSAMNALSGWMCVHVRGINQWGPRLVSGVLCTLFAPPFALLFIQYFNHTQHSRDEALLRLSRQTD